MYYNLMQFTVYTLNYCYVQYVAMTYTANVLWCTVPANNVAHFAAL